MSSDDVRRRTRDRMAAEGIPQGSDDATANALGAPPLGPVVTAEMRPFGEAANASPLATKALAGPGHPHAVLVPGFGALVVGRHPERGPSGILANGEPPNFLERDVVVQPDGSWHIELLRKTPRLVVVVKGMPDA